MVRLALALVPSSDSRPTLAVVPPSDSPAQDLERLGDQIAELAAHLDAATYRLLVLIREFDAREGWHSGFRTCAHWLSWRTGIDLGAAREKVRVARALEHLPRLSEVMRLGELSYSKARALTRVATPENEEELMGFAEHATASHVETLVRTWRRVDRLEERDQERERHRSRFLTVRPDVDGMYVVRGRLDPEVGAMLMRALEAAGEALYWRTGEDDPVGDLEITEPEETTPGQRRADAIGFLAERALQGGLVEAGGGRGDGGCRGGGATHIDGAPFRHSGLRRKRPTSGDLFGSCRRGGSEQGALVAGRNRPSHRAVHGREGGCAGVTSARYFC